MGGGATTPCAHCQRLPAEVAVLAAAVADLQAAVAQLQAQLASARKNSSTSSKPPSSDIVKPPKPQPPPGQDHCQRGGQPGHPKHERPLLAPELLTAPPHDYVPEMCPDCGRGLRPAGDDVRVVQQVEIAEVPILIEEHRSHPGWCAHCCKVPYAPLPAAVASGGLAGPRLTTLIAYFKGACHARQSHLKTNILKELGQRVSSAFLTERKDAAWWRRPANWWTGPRPSPILGGNARTSSTAWKTFSSWASVASWPAAMTSSRSPPGLTRTTPSSARSSSCPTASLPTTRSTGSSPWCPPPPSRKCCSLGCCSVAASPGIGFTLMAKPCVTHATIGKDWRPCTWSVPGRA